MKLCQGHLQYQKISQHRIEQRENFRETHIKQLFVCSANCFVSLGSFWHARDTSNKDIKYILHYNNTYNTELQGLHV